MTRPILRKGLILLKICLYVAVTMQIENIQDHDPEFKPNDDNFDSTWKEHNTFIRTKRGTQKTGFFKTLFSVVGEQYSDTKNTLNKVGDLINDNFLPDNVTTLAPNANEPNATKPPYKITRTEFNKIISRNLKGLNRLFQIELKDALRQSRISKKEYDRNVSKEISKFL